ncbi:MAG: hypothetical protein KDH48_01405, partial [Rhodoferax sp.]|nr:hypothetical protein [Rhodoferax sp.]
MANDNSGINGTWAATVPEPGTRALFSIARASFGLSRRITQRRRAKGQSWCRSVQSMLVAESGREVTGLPCVSSADACPG